MCLLKCEPFGNAASGTINAICGCMHQVVNPLNAEMRKSEKDRSACCTDPHEHPAVAGSQGSLPLADATLHCSLEA